MKKRTNNSDRKKSGQTADPNPASKKRADNKSLILKVTEKLMLDEGYAAVSTRRVAKEAGLKPPLVHYYFPTTDDLFLSVFRNAADREMDRLTEAVRSTPSLQAIWESYCSQDQTALAIEFMALANHRKAMREEIIALTERERQRRAELLLALLDTESIQPGNMSGEGLNVLLIGVARTLVMEQGLGISIGHADARRFVEWWLNELGRTTT